MKTFYLNGQKYSTNDNFSLLDLLSYFDYNLSLLVVEYNSFISTKKDWNQIMISDNDKVEVVTIVGGG
uniref:Thiamine biosynthesis protein S n=1 Tax=Guinardia striata TaxID=1514137 RepID=A0A2U9NP31_9STRA|nr:thiamine biosynthesis protein S [Guinardia striata]AWT38893.1 thiamine biosynthesis protein S [Guinardia striata]